MVHASSRSLVLVASSVVFSVQHVVQSYKTSYNTSYNTRTANTRSICFPPDVLANLGFGFWGLRGHLPEAPAVVHRGDEQIGGVGGEVRHLQRPRVSVLPIRVSALRHKQLRVREQPAKGAPGPRRGPATIGAPWSTRARAGAAAPSSVPTWRERVSQSANRSVNRSSANQSANWSVNQSVNQSGNQEFLGYGWGSGKKTIKGSGKKTIYSYNKSSSTLESQRPSAGSHPTCYI
eukprot:1179756-Prorocentrum_minimum.AAC.4